MTFPDKYAIDVMPKPQFLPDQSSEADERYAFAYTIRITNRGSEPVQLISRYWKIINARQEVQEVRGLGVVGEQPHLAPGESYEYTSGCVLDTPMGTMQGHYQMLAADGTRFDAPIPEFLLALPRVLH